MSYAASLKVSAVWLALASFAACDSRSDYWEGDNDDVLLDCRSFPGDCEGEIGGDCIDTEDCDDGLCCHDKNCGRGMCTYSCRDDLDCPNVMRCEHDYCFFICDRDSDCGPGQSCEHGGTICEYEGGHD